MQTCPIPNKETFILDKKSHNNREMSVQSCNFYEKKIGIVSAKRDQCIQYKIPSTCNTNVTLALKCMANQKFRALQFHDRYSDSQCVRSNV